MDDSDKAGADFASKPSDAWAAVIEQTAYRDGFMPASLGINYTPCQAADACSSDQRWPREELLLSWPWIETARKGKKDGKKVRRREEVQRRAFLWACMPMRSSFVIYTSTKSYAPRSIAACIRILYKDACVLYCARLGLTFGDFMDIPRSKRCVMQYTYNDENIYSFSTVRIFTLKIVQYVILK